MKRPPFVSKQNLMWKGQLTLRSTWGIHWKTQHHKGCFYRMVVNQNRSQRLLWNESFMSIASVYYRWPQDDKYGLSLALLLNLSEIAPGAFLTSSLLTETLVESVYTHEKKKTPNIWTPLIALSCHLCSRMLTTCKKNATSPLEKASRCCSK